MFRKLFTPISLLFLFAGCGSGSSLPAEDPDDPSTGIVSLEFEQEIAKVNEKVVLTVNFRFDADDLGDNGFRDPTFQTDVVVGLDPSLEYVEGTAEIQAENDDDLRKEPSIFVCSGGSQILVFALDDLDLPERAIQSDDNATIRLQVRGSAIGRQLISAAADKRISSLCARLRSPEGTTAITLVN